MYCFISKTFVVGCQYQAIAVFLLVQLPMAAVRDTRGLPPSEETPLNARQDNDDTNTPITPARGLVTMLLMSILILIQSGLPSLIPRDQFLDSAS